MRDATGATVRDLRGEEQVGGQPWDAELPPTAGCCGSMSESSSARATPGSSCADWSEPSRSPPGGSWTDVRCSNPADLPGKAASSLPTGGLWWPGELPGLPAKLFRLGDGEATRLRSVLPTGVKPLRYWPLPGGAAQARSDGSIALFDDQGIQVQVLEAHHAEVRAVAVAADATWAASADTTGLIHLWDVDTLPASGRCGMPCSATTGRCRHSRSRRRATR